MSIQSILVLNCGSSSLKFSIFNRNSYRIELKGIVEFLSSFKIKVTWSINNRTYIRLMYKESSHHQALHFVMCDVLKQNSQLFNSIMCIGHRVVHGGSKIDRSVIINDTIIQCIENAIDFAPLHNPINLLGIKASFNIFPHLKEKNVAVFDTTFHSTLPKSAFLYAIPYKFYKQYGIRRYGAHGISHFYSTCHTSKLLNKEIKELNIITCHLGNGASIAAICNGICVDTSMGLTPLEGLVMGTRSGDIDPSIIFFMKNKLNLNIDIINDILIHKSGLLGVSGLSSDLRILEDNYHLSNKAKLSIEIFCHRLAKYISAYTSLMEGRLDAIVFTGGIGENSCIVRSITVSKLSLLGCQLDKQLNLNICFGREGFISSKNSKIPLLVISANEELVIAKESCKLIEKLKEI